MGRPRYNRFGLARDYGIAGTIYAGIRSLFKTRPWKRKDKDTEDYDDLPDVDTPWDDNPREDPFPYVPDFIPSGQDQQLRNGYNYYKNGSETETIKLNMSDGGHIGTTRRYASTAYGGRKRHNTNKILKSGIQPLEQCLGVRKTDGTSTWVQKYAISEYGRNGGFQGICLNFANGSTPMHVYDLNHFVGSTPDVLGNYPASATSQNIDVNARSWWWSAGNLFYPIRTDPTLGLNPPAGAENQDHRYYIDNPKSLNLDEDLSNKVYRKSIAIDYMVYGCNRMETMYDLRVIKIFDPKMCPDYIEDLDVDELQTFQHNWQAMVRPYTTNPMLKGLEPGPKVPRWFKTVAKKRIKMPEQTSDVDRVPCVQGKMYIKLNEVNNHSWNMNGFTNQSGAAYYDGVPNVETNDATENDAFNHKPHYKARYYLVIRALSTIDNSRAISGGQDGDLPVSNRERVQFYNSVNAQTSSANPVWYELNTSENNPATLGTEQNNLQSMWPEGIPSTAYQPSYDLAIRSFYLVNEK